MEEITTPNEKRAHDKIDRQSQIGKTLETQDRCALEPFAPKLIHESPELFKSAQPPGFFQKSNVIREERCRAANCELPTHHRYSQ